MDNKYGLHDSEITKIEFTNSMISLYFDKGVYNLDGEGKEQSLSPSCKCNITLPIYNVKDIPSYLVIHKKWKNKIVEISYDSLCKMLEKNYFSIDYDFYSYFANAVLLKGFVGKYALEFLITDIQNMELVF